MFMRCLTTPFGVGIVSVEVVDATQDKHIANALGNAYAVMHCSKASRVVQMDAVVVSIIGCAAHVSVNSHHRRALLVASPVAMHI